MAKKKAEKEVLEPKTEEVIRVEVPEPVITAMQPFKPEEYNLDQVRADEISEKFKPHLLEMSRLMPLYDQIMRKEVNDETVKEAKALRLEFRKHRSGAVNTHKEQKALYLKPGQFVDAWKTATEFFSQEKEDKLSAIEKHFEKMEEERKSLLETERRAILSELGVTAFPMRFGDLPEDVWESYLEGQKISVQAAKEKAENDKKIADAKAVEEKEKADKLKKENDELKKQLDEKKKVDEANTKLHNERFKLLNAVIKFLPDGFDLLDLHLKDADFLKSSYLVAKKAMDEHKAEEARLLQEKTEAEQKQKALEVSPDKERLTAWLNATKLHSIKMETLSENSQKVVTEIDLKFASFKLWALKQIESL